MRTIQPPGARGVTEAARQQDDRDLLEECLDRLRERTGLEVSVEAAPPGAHPEAPWGHALIRIIGPTSSTDYAAETLARVRPSNVERLVARARTANDRSRAIPLLCTDHVSAQVGTALRAAGVEYLDASGNACIDAPDARIQIEGVPARPRRGRRVGRPSSSPLARPIGLRVVRALLTTPELLHATTRAIAAAAGVSQPSAARVLRELAEEGWIRIVGDRRRAMRMEELHLRWVDGYLDMLRPTLEPERMRPAGHDAVAVLEAKIDSLASDGRALVGGAIAAERLGADLGSHEVSLHVPSPGGRRAIAQELELVPDPGGPITVVESIGAPSAERAPATRGLADALDVHAELLVEADSRSVEAAEWLRTEHLLARWKDA